MKETNIIYDSVSNTWSIIVETSSDYRKLPCYLKWEQGS